MAHEYLTTKEAADYLGLSPSRIRQFIAYGRLKSKKHGRDHLILRSDIEYFAAISRQRTGRPCK